MSTLGIIEAISHAISEPKPEAMLAGMHERLGIDPEAIRSGMPEAPAVTLYYKDGQFHAFWYDGLSEIHRARIQSHIDAHHKLGDLRPLEGFYWVESLISGQANLDHLDELKDFDLEARTIRWTLNKHLGREVVDLLAEAEIGDALAGIARREHIDIVIVCAWAARSWPYPAWISSHEHGTWRNLSANQAEMPASEAQVDPGNTYALRNHYFDAVRFCVALPLSLVTRESPESLEMLFAEDAAPALEMPETELLLPDFAEDFGDVSLDMLFAEGLPENSGPLDLEMLFGGFPEAAPLDKATDAASLESLFAESPVQEAATLESLFAESEALTAPIQPTTVPSLESLFGDPAPAMEPPTMEASLDALFGEMVVPPSIQPIAKPEVPVEEAKSEAASSLESLFGAIDPPAFVQPMGFKAEIPVVAEATPEGEPSLESLFGELPAFDTPEPLFVQPEVPAVEAQQAEVPALESLFGEFAAPDDQAIPLGAEAKPEEEHFLEDLFAVIPDTSEEAPFFGEVPSEEVLMSSLEALFAEEEPISAEPPAPEANFIHLMAGEPQGAAIFAGALPLARKLEWICAESPEVVHGLLAQHLAHLECRVLYCPPQQMTRPELEASLEGLPEHLSLKVGFGLPEGHSLFLLTDAENNRIFYHQPPTEEPATLVESWTDEAGATEIDWRQERFEMLWEDRLRPHVHVETLGESLENLFAMS